MRWTDRQLAMLREIGVVLPRWPAAADHAAVAVADETKRTAEPARRTPGPARTSSTSAVILSGAEDPVATSTGPASAAPLSRSDWLVVTDLGSDEETELLANMLAAVDIAEAAVEPSRRAARIDPRDADVDAAITAASPRVVLALGRVAAQKLLATDEPLGKLRGRRHDRGGIDVVVTWPPSYLLRQPEEKARAWADLCLAATVAAAAAGE